MPDGRLIDVTSGTKHAALEALYRKHQTMLLRLAWLLTGNRLDAEDLVQAVFLRYSRIDQPPANPKAYLRTMVVNAARDLGREHGRESPSQIVPDGISNTRSALLGAVFPPPTAGSGVGGGRHAEQIEQL